MRLCSPISFDMESHGARSQNFLLDGEISLHTDEVSSLMLYHSNIATFFYSHYVGPTTARRIGSTTSAADSAKTITDKNKSTPTLWLTNLSNPPKSTRWRLFRRRLVLSCELLRPNRRGITTLISRDTYSVRSFQLLTLLRFAEGVG